MGRNPYRGWRRSIWKQIEDVLSRIVTFVIETFLIPIRLVYQWWGALTRLPFRLQRRVRSVYWTRLLWSTLLWPIYFTIWSLNWVVEAVATWWPRVQWMCLLQGLPAVIVAVLVAVPLFGKSRDALTYDIEARGAVASHDYDRAEMLFRALLKMDPEDDDYRFNLARVCWARGEREAAMRMIRSLAPRNMKGFPPAHYWLAEYLYLTNPHNQQDMAEVDAHLKRAISGSGEYVKRAHALLGQRYLDSGRLADAEKEFKEAAKDEPRLWIRLAEIHARQGMMTQAKRDAEQALSHFGDIEKKDPENDEARMYAAQALTFLGQFAEAAAMLEGGLVMKQDRRYTQALGQVYLSWADATRAQSRSNRQREKELLLQSFKYDPFNPLLLRYLINGLTADGPDGEMVRGLIRDASSANLSPSVISLLLAVEADARGYNESARTYLEKAKLQDERSSRLMSELAIHYVNQPPASDAQANALVELGLRAWPRDPFLSHARAVLRARRREWLDALMDMNVAAKSSVKTNDVSFQRLFAHIYQELNMVDKAQQHEQRARQIELSTNTNRK
ncbi:MAG: tetratricopeptide repeat protein [Planctomycetes bacterium]|nr:tetratricopeptide repeat protein [Planctomycetota bacterium]